MASPGDEVLTATEQGERVVSELARTGTPADGFGACSRGDLEGALRAAVRVQRRIVWRQRNYGCFEPW
jgi:hypothetical protein